MRWKTRQMNKKKGDYQGRQSSRLVYFILTYYFYMGCCVSGHKMEATG